MFQKVVWILGAGFSRPLGGPLLPDLLSPSSWVKVTAAYPHRSWPVDGPERMVVDLYQQHRRGSASGVARWSDAEEFLSFLDSAADGHRPTRAEFEQLGDAFVKKFGGPAAASKEASTAARRMIAAECGAFLVDAPLDGENWLPYRSWARSLGPDQSTVITFNYDLVLEKLAAKEASRLYVLGPNEDPGAARKAVPVLKLHGSINWLRLQAGNHAEYQTGRSDTEFLDVDGSQLAIASPGPTKLALTQELRGLWLAAENAIREADAVVFVGYRFPPSDSMAQERLLAALGGSDSIYLAIHTVLGPGVDQPDSARLRDLLLRAMRVKRRKVTPANQDLNNWADKGFNLVLHPQWAQDFIGGAWGGDLTQPFLRTS
jgi:hypothetical protein